MPDTVAATTCAAPCCDATSVELVGPSRAISRVQEFVRRAASIDGGVLITAEPGCGVDSIARELHARSRRADSPFVAVDCAVPDAVTIEQQLFGGAPVDSSDLEAVTAASRVAAARGGVLFLQDVNELPAGAQARLARIARDGEVCIDGLPAPAGFRLVASAATSVDADVDTHRFRADLFRRLTSVRIDVPPLRERPEDVPEIAKRLLLAVCVSQGVAPRAFTQAALALVGALAWPGNAAELRETLVRVVSSTADAVVQIEHLLPALRLPRAAGAFVPGGSLREARLRFERDYITSVLQHHDWHMTHAAQALGIQRPNLYRKARQLGIPLTRVHD